MENLKNEIDSLENVKKETDSAECEIPPDVSVSENVGDKHKKDTYDRTVLKRAYKSLLNRTKRKGKVSSKSCSRGDSNDFRVDRQVKLRCRQLPTVVKELRRAIMRQDWDEVTTLVLILCHPGLKYYSSIILKVCFILLLSHHNSSFSLLQNFIRISTEYVLEEDVNKFIRILFALRKTALKPLESGRYIRKSGDYKVTRDPEFEEL